MASTVFVGRRVVAPWCGWGLRPRGYLPIEFESGVWQGDCVGCKACDLLKKLLYIFLQFKVFVNSHTLDIKRARSDSAAGVLYILRVSRLAVRAAVKTAICIF